MAEVEAEKGSDALLGDEALDVAWQRTWDERRRTGAEDRLTRNQFTKEGDDADSR